MKYRCLILDHDDTCVDSTLSIHYQAQLEILRRMRPALPPITPEEFFEKNFHPGITRYLTEELHFSPEEMEEEFRIWQEFTKNRTPDFYPGIIALLKDFRAKGGWVTVVSHSEEGFIRKAYEEKGEGFMPDLIYGWDMDPEKRKPHPYPCRQILQELAIPKEDALIVDDLKPGIEMALNAGVDAAAACWSHNIPVIREYMQENCVALLESPQDFSTFLALN